MGNQTYFGAIVYNLRLVNIFTLISYFFIYQFYREIFKKESKGGVYASIIRLIVFIVLLFQFTFVIEDTVLDKLIYSGLTLLLGFLIYIPCFTHSFRMLIRVKKTENRPVYLSLLFMTLTFATVLLSWISYILSIISDHYINPSGQGYGTFYILQNIFVICTMIVLYLGFIMPRWFKKLVEKDAD